MTDRTDERRFYNVLHAAAADRRHPHERARLAAVTGALRRHAGAPGGALRLLDLGCGSGWLADRLTPWGAVTGVDLADEVVADAARRYPRVRFVSADFTAALPLGDERFDVVVCSEVIEHVEDQPGLVALMAARLHAGGVAIVTCPNRRGAAAWWSQPGLRPQPREAWLTPAELRGLLHAGFEIVETRTIVGDYAGWGFPGHSRRRRDRWRHRLLRALGVGTLRAALGHGLYVVACGRRRP